MIAVVQKENFKEEKVTEKFSIRIFLPAVCNVMHNMIL